MTREWEGYCSAEVEEAIKEIDRIYCEHELSLRIARPEAASAEAAAIAFRDSLVPRADKMEHGVYPLWHGWALYDAFMAGAKFAQSPQTKT